MSNPSIKFIRQDGGLGAVAQGEDHISGMLFFNDNLPAGFTSDKRIQQVFNLAEAEALGIVTRGSGLDGTGATVDTTITDIGTDGDKITFRVNRGSGKTKVTLGEYIKVAADDDTTKVAAGVAAAINADTAGHGYSATSNLAVVTITAPEKDGDEADAYAIELVKSPSGSSFAATGLDFGSGADPFIDVMHYHISEFFRTRSAFSDTSTGLYVGIFAEPSGSHDFDEVRKIQRFANGAIRQVGVFSKETFAAADVSALHAVCEDLFSKDMPLVAVYTADASSLAINSLPDLSSLQAFRVAVGYGQDGANTGAELYDLRDMTIGCMGAALGTLSAANVNENIGWLARFNIAQGQELDSPAMGEGTLLKNMDEGQIDQVGNRHYLFARKYIGFGGSYFNDSRTASSEFSDFSSLENVRAFDKAVRLVRLALLPSLKSPLLFNADGTLSIETVDFLTNEAQRPIDRMVQLNELSAYQVLIDPAQKTLSTGVLEVSLQKVPTGVARTFQIKVGYTSSIT